METKYEKIVDGATGEFTVNAHGYFCRSWNGIEWPWGNTGQLAAASEEAAVKNLLDAVDES